MAKESLKEKLKKRQADLKAKASSGNLVFLKPDTTIRVRILPAGPEDEFIREVTQFYLGGEIKGVISPETFNEPCAIYEEYEKLKNSKDESERKLAKDLNLRKRYLAYCVIYKDDKGKEVADGSPKFVLLTNSMYQGILDLYLDEDEWGDMTDPSEEGYDLKLSRTGSGKTDTEYSVKPCKNSPCPKPFNKASYNIEQELRKIIPSYEETKEVLEKFLGTDISFEKTEKKEGKGAKKLVKKPKKDTD